MEAGGKDLEEETLQTAFKKLRVDAWSRPGAVSAAEAAAPRAAARGCLDAGGAKPKVGAPKDNWHGSMRKTSRGASRTQRRRRSKSPILHPPKFTYCSAAAVSALSTPSGGLKHQRLTAPEPPEPLATGGGRAAVPPSAAAQKDLPSSGAAGHISPLVFGSRAAYETRVQETTPATSSGRDAGCGVRSAEESGPETSARGGAESAPPRIPGDAADFRALSESPRVPCSCALKETSGPREEPGRGAGSPCRCRPLPQGWQGVEVYSFTGLRNVISECEGSREDAHRTVSTNSSASVTSYPTSVTSYPTSVTSYPTSVTSYPTSVTSYPTSVTSYPTSVTSYPTSSSSPPSGSPRSCSEQARSYVDDITIEDLSGYMEYYLFIPKKMSHMAEMMYT